jgi:NAD-dependent deacetylase sirtuin 4
MGSAEIPPDPKSLLDDNQLDGKAEELAKWLSNKKSVLCLTGAGLSTDSGIPDYRGNNGSYHKVCTHTEGVLFLSIIIAHIVISCFLKGHKPIIHQMFMESEYQRKRYWGRSMVGWSKFDAAKPNRGHYALAALERHGILGVQMEDKQEFYDELDQDEFLLSSGQRQLAVITQNVDSLHQAAGSKEVLQIHGGGRVVRCMRCGHRMDRNEYHQMLEIYNQDWIDEHQPLLVQDDEGTNREGKGQNQMRPDGDAQLGQQADYNQVRLPTCPHCQESNLIKPDVVFFGDTVPKNRVAICQEAVDSSDGILVVGSSLAVHSAYRHIRAASHKKIPLAILNVGQTRAEAEGLEGIFKIEASISDTLERCVRKMVEMDAGRSECEVSSAFR